MSGMPRRLVAAVMVTAVVAGILGVIAPPAAVSYAVIVALSGVGALFVLLPSTGIRRPPRPFAQTTGTQHRPYPTAGPSGR
jgi:hypothetical protein